MKLKLTPVQKSVLIEVGTSSVFDCEIGYKPAKKLIELGIVSSTKLSYGRVRLTPNDRTAEAVRDLI